eukprot:gnl/Carplike_NY0171/8309_a11528_136.p1 GENE.gnl/Carplike_NY0171/8309_a11528_136~~gnl/Carplike_NY0171/8309_a11528_136.p1  ORF type:complete len:352 (+),score=43.33 gnl/Carplike_NY0171/8309_a11528_136:92-1057(+)
MVRDLRKCCPDCVSSIETSIDRKTKNVTIKGSSQQLDELEKHIFFISMPNTKVQPFKGKNQVLSSAFTRAIFNISKDSRFIPAWKKFILDHFAPKDPADFHCQSFSASSPAPPIVDESLMYPRIAMSWNNQLHYFCVAIYFMRRGHLVPVSPLIVKEIKFNFQNVTTCLLGSFEVGSFDESKFNLYFKEHCSIAIVNKITKDCLIWGPNNDAKRVDLCEKALSESMLSSETKMSSYRPGDEVSCFTLTKLPDRISTKYIKEIFSEQFPGIIFSAKYIQSHSMPKICVYMKPSLPLSTVTLIIDSLDFQKQLYGAIISPKLI